MVCVLATRGLNNQLKPLSDQMKDYKIGICCFSAKHPALKRKRKDWLARNQDNVLRYVDPRTVVSVKIAIALQEYS
jgi:hypothetical protein